MHDLRKYIFDWNVRDFQGYNIEVNKDIKNTLYNKDFLDFWWLNNGVTILASNASVTGKTITLDDVQIINGLQTTHCIYDYIKSKIDNGEDLNEYDKKRSILIKIIVIDEGKARDKIIKATNFQTSISPASYRATERIHYDLEVFLKSHDLYYDRKKNYYKNIGKPVSKIISIPFLAQCVNTILLKDPNVSRARPSSLIKDEAVYNRLFTENISPETYLFCVKVVKKIQARLKMDIGDFTFYEKTNLKFHIVFVTIMKALKNKNYQGSNISILKLEDISDDLIDNAIVGTIKLARDYGSEQNLSLDVVSKSKSFVDYLKEKITV